MTRDTLPDLLNRKLDQLPGIDPRRAQLLTKLGLNRAVDLLFYFPRSYEEPALLAPLEQFAEGLRVTFLGTLVALDERVTQSGKHMLGAQLTTDDGGSVRLLWFNQPYRMKQLVCGQRLQATGVLRSTVLNWEMVQPQVTQVDQQDSPTEQLPRPVYSLTEGLKQSQMRDIVRSAVPDLIELVSEVMPQDLRERLEVLPINQALQQVHFPRTLQEAHAAKRRFKLQELLVLQLAVSLQRAQRAQEATAPPCPPTGKIHARILHRLPHALTPDQELAIADIGADMAKTIPMNRLLQGDVGSGKTLVAQYAMLLCVAHGCQAVMMAPTEVLAQQHRRTLDESLGSSRVHVGLLTGSVSQAQRRHTIDRLASGDVNIVVGTQAVLADDVVFDRLGLVIVDEQHKFGVLQRAKLKSGDAQPHYLVLSATPIPRSIAMTIFGDLDLSTIRTKPPGRAPVHSYVAPQQDLSSWWQFVDRQIESGRQAFVIVPRVAESNSDDVASAEGIFKQLSENEFAHRQVLLLHGRMDSHEKAEALQSFASGKCQILVSTTVIEVGIDVPNATVMTILDADRLGLSQLHQLRGRASRGTHAGYVCAVASAGCQGEESERLAAFAKSDDGFELAEIDLRMRGPGDLLGTSQSGVPPLRVADLTEDRDLVEFAHQVATELLQLDPALDAEPYRLLRQQTVRRYGAAMQLSDVG